MGNEQRDKTNKGLLFPNHKKSDKGPNIRGFLNVEGVEYEVSGWTRVPTSGKLANQKCLSLSIQRQGSYQKPQGGSTHSSAPTPAPSHCPPQTQPQAPAQGQYGGDVPEDEVPF
jgi:hypothetical protein